ncbi:MAG: fused MFS/spermidine synthase [Vicinamibacteria bacterium]
MNQASHRAVTPALLLASLCSGCAALLSQVMWTRILSLVFGSTIEAVAAVTAIFMAGLAVGSATAPRLVLVLDGRGALALYTRIELGIATAAVALAFILPSLEALRARIGAGPVWVFVAILLLIPTSLMGMTLVVQARAAASTISAASSPRVSGLLFAANTLGAVAGAYFSVLVLVPSVGVRNTLLIAAALHTAAAAIGRCVFIIVPIAREGVDASEPETAVRDSPSPRRSKRQVSQAAVDTVSEASSPPPAPPVALVLLALMIAGFAGLTNEVAWTRAFILIAGPTVHAFAFVLGAIVLGLAVGAFASSALLPAIKEPRTAFALTQAAVVFSCAYVMRAFASMPLSYGDAVRKLVDDPGALITLQATASLGLLFLPAAFSGALFPLGLRLLSARYSSASAMGYAGASNTLGAIAGASLAGFWMLPSLGLDQTLRLAASLSAVSSLMVAWHGSWPRRIIGLGTSVAALAAVIGAPAFDRDLFAGGAYKYSAYDTSLSVEDVLRRGELVSYVEGRVANVSVKRIGSSFSLAVDGKVDATSGGDMVTQRLLAHVPFLISRNPANALVIGLGSGVTAAAAASHEGASVTAVEISPDVVSAAREFFQTANRDVMADPRVNVVVGDARQVLLASKDHYDVVISEPSNPWMAGVSALFTREFFASVRSRLNPDGVFCQWGHLYNMSDRDLATLLSTFADVFPAGRVYVISEADILIVGGASPRPLETSRIDLVPERARLDLQASMLTPAMLREIPSVALADIEWRKDARRHTDDRPVLDFSAPLSIHAQSAAANRRLLLPEDAPKGPAAVRTRLALLRASVSAEWAFEISERAVLSGVGDPDVTRDLVKNALRLHRAPQAEAAFNRAIERALTAPLLVGRALLYWNTERPELALDSLARASSLDPHNVQAYLLAAEIQSASGALEAARKLVAHVHDVDLRNVEATGLLAEVELKEGRFSLAVAKADEALRLDPEETRALEVRALGLAQSGAVAPARAAFAALIAATPDETSGRINAGVFEMQQGNAPAAARFFKDAVDLDAGSVNAYRGLQEAATALNRPDILRVAERGLSRLAR